MDNNNNNDNNKIENLLAKILENQTKMQMNISTIQSDIKKLGTKIDAQITPKIEVLFDGYKQNSEQLTRIEEEVSKHEEVILKRVK